MARQDESVVMVMIQAAVHITLSFTSLRHSGTNWNHLDFIIFLSTSAVAYFETPCLCLYGAALSTGEDWLLHNQEITFAALHICKKYLQLDYFVVLSDWCKFCDFFVSNYSKQYIHN
jgi:cytochrome c oxidase assembly factor CtaG